MNDGLGRRSLLAGAVSLLGARIAGTVLNLLSLGVVARALHPVEFGRWAVVAGALAIASTGTTLGTDTLVMRSVARGDAARVAGASLRLQLQLSAVLVAFAAVAVFVGALAGAWLVAALALLPIAVVSVGTAVARGAERQDLHLAATTIFALANLGAVLVVSTLDGSVMSFVAATGVAATVGAIAALLVAERCGTPLGVRGAPLGALRAEITTFAAMVVTTSALLHAPTLITSWVAGSVAAGAIGIATRVVDSLRAVPAALFTAAFPALSRGERSASLVLAARLVLVGSIGGAVLLMVLAEPLADLLDQPFAADAIRTIAVVLPLAVLRLGWSFKLLGEDRERVVLLASLVGLAVTVAGAFIAADSGPEWVALAIVVGTLAQVVFLAAADRFATRSLDASPR